MLSVGASDDRGEKVYFSSYGQGVDLVAPGVTALVHTTESQQGRDCNGRSTVSGLYRSFSGTSAAAPHVSGAAALLMSNLNNPNNPATNLAPEDVEQILQRTANDRGPVRNATAPYDDETGWGLLDVGKAVATTQPGAFRIIHDRLTTNGFAVDANVRISVPTNYSSPTAYLAAGVYVCDRYRVTGRFSPRTSLVRADENILGVWARNGRTNLWNAANPVQAEADVRIVGWNQNTVDAAGYTLITTLVVCEPIGTPAERNEAAVIAAH